MAIGLNRKNTIIGIEQESTEGTYVAPSGAASFIQPAVDGFEIVPGRELLERNILVASPGLPTPKLGIKSVTGALPVEWRSSGTAGGGGLDYGSLVETALGATRTATSTTTTTTHTATVINMAAPDASKYTVGDIVLIKEAGAWEARPISAVGATDITLAFALDNGAPSDGVEIEALTTYLTANTGHPPLSISYYWANEISQAVVGGKVSTMALENFVPGQLAALNFSVEGLTYRDEADESAPFTPTYDTGTPPVILEACVWKNGVLMSISNLTLSVSNTLSFVTDTCDENGKIRSLVTSREITGSFNPNKDDTLTTEFDEWNDGTEFSLFAYARNPSSTAGEFEPGSTVALWMPQCLKTEFQTTDVDNILVDEIAFRSTRGVAGDQEELFMGFM